MIRTKLWIWIVSLTIGLSPALGAADTVLDREDPAAPDKLLVVWTSGDKEVALKMVFMYTFNAKKNSWWGAIRFLIWGPSSKLLAEDAELQQEIKKMKDIGIELVACKACADLYGVSEKLEQLGVTVRYAGKELTDLVKSGWATLTF